MGILKLNLNKKNSHFWLWQYFDKNAPSFWPLLTFFCYLAKFSSGKKKKRSVVLKIYLSFVEKRSAALKIYISFVEDFEEHLDPIEFCYQKTLAKHPPKTNLKLILWLYIYQVRGEKLLNKYVTIWTTIGSYKVVVSRDFLKVFFSRIEPIWAPDWQLSIKKYSGRYLILL